MEEALHPENKRQIARTTTRLRKKKISIRRGHWYQRSDRSEKRALATT